jgi:16S rRNA (cytosine967-C5)-methyltransferase
MTRRHLSPVKSGEKKMKFAQVTQKTKSSTSTHPATDVSRGARNERERRVHETYTSERSDVATKDSVSGRMSKTKFDPNRVGTHVIRVKELLQLWHKMIALETLPQVDKWIAEQFKLNAKYGSKDRRWYSEVLFAMVRFAPFVSHQMGCFHFSKMGFVLAVGSLDAELFLYHTLLRLKFNLKNELSDIDGVLTFLSKKLARNIDEDRLDFEKTEKNPLFFGVAQEFLEPLKQRQTQSGWTVEQTQKFVEAQASRPPLWIRLNFLDKKDLVCQELRSLDFEVHEHSIDNSPGDTMSVVGTKGIFSTDCYQKGWIEIQDFASQSIGQKVNFKPGEFVRDACAGGGGKTMQLASRSLNKGVIYASDVREYKLDEVKKRARRAGFFNIRCAPWNGIGKLDFSKEVKLRGGFDWVLVDAPCSSSGTWRRNPDAKYRVTNDSLQSVQKLQMQLVTEASQSVIVGGHLVYSTCSWLISENEQIVEAFLKSHPDFNLVEQCMLGLPDANADAMFVAVMKRAQGDLGANTKRNEH